MTRSAEREARARAEFLRTGRVPLGYGLAEGARSLVRDPWKLVVDQLPGPLGFRLRQLWYGRACRSLGKGVLIDPGVRLLQPAGLAVDEFSYLGGGCEIHTGGGVVAVGKRCHLTGWILGHAGVEIGDYVGCAGSLLSVTESHEGGYRMAGPMIPEEQRQLRRGKVTVCRDAFLARGSMVLPGVTVGEGAVVAPFSLVVHDVPPWTVVSGVPAVRTGTREPVVFPDP